MTEPKPFDPDTASPEQVASFFLKCSVHPIADGGSYAIAYALLTQRADLAALRATVERIQTDIQALYDKWKISPELKAELERPLR